MAIKLDGTYGFTFPDGSASVPSITGATSGNTSGIFFAASNTVSLATSGTERLRVDSAGNLGIGTTSPDSKLAIYNATGTSQIRFGASSNYYWDISRDNDTTGNLWISNYNASGSRTTRITIDTSGNVGIGTTSPSSKLHVVGSNPSILTEGSIPGVSFKTTQAGTKEFRLVSGYQDATSISLVDVTAGNLQRILIDTNGNVGIGTITPTTTLNVKNSSDYRTALFETASTLGPSIQIKGSRIYELRSTDTGASEGGGLFFIYDKTAESIRMAVDSSGNIGIGTGSPTAKLDIYGASGPVYQFVRSGGSTGSDYAYYRASGGSTSVLNIAYGSGFAYTYSDATNSYTIGTSSNAPLYFYTNNTTRVLVTNGGEFWWNNFATRPHQATTTANTGFQISTQYGVEVNNKDALVGIFNRTNSTGAIVEWKYNGTNVVGSVSTNGTGTTYGSSSDERLKENIVDAQSAATVIESIKIRAFDWKSNGSHQEYGVIAQELLHIIPEAVQVPDDPESMMGVDCSKLIPALIKYVQELEKRITALEGAA